MSAKSSPSDVLIRLALLGGLIALSDGAAAADDEQPDMAFLEYLGSWEESDEDWLLLNEPLQETASEETRSDPAPDGEESPELQNES